MRRVASPDATVRVTDARVSSASSGHDIDASRAALASAGLDPHSVTEGSRTTPEGDVVAWRMCDVGPGPYDASLPFLIQWTTPMAPGPAQGPIVISFSLTPPDPDLLADVLLAVGFEPVRHWPRRVFGQADGTVITINAVEEPGDLGADEPRASVALAVTSGEPTRRTLDGVAVTTVGQAIVSPPSTGIVWPLT